ncbi:hypothetical protein [Parasitella parasitica]|uniref:HotDog ACOT-type domain-containing protein n=1 Tax=Parasitella parasitica TaxID=35722 RepID=A0A0B7N6S8_9FUNG|nr:hypothetical protein [Parasitella parasitica]
MFVTQPVFQRLLPDPYTEAGNVRVDKKPAHVSRVTMTEIISPAQCNMMGFAYAGTILSWIDIAAGISAKKHAVSPSVTRSVDDVAFLHPVKVGDIVRIDKPSIAIIHIYIRMTALSPRPEAKTHLGRIFSDFQTIVVPELIPLSPMEIKRFEMAETRRQARFSQKTPNHSRIRDLMREWSQGLREKADADAPIKRHPGYFPSSEQTSPVFEEVSALEEQDMLLQTRKRGRRFSQDPKMLQQVRERPMDYTFAEVVELVMPQHANTLKITFGGQIMAWMETCAIASATSSGVGDVVTIRSMVSRSFNSSMEVYVSVEAENLLTGETKFTNDGFFTVTAVDSENTPVIIPKVIPQTESGLELYEGGFERRQKRLNQRLELVNLVNASQENVNPVIHLSADE